MKRYRRIFAIVVVSSLPMGRTGLAEHDAARVLPGTCPLKIVEPLDEVMVSGINRFALREIENSPQTRAAKWQRNYSNHDAYAKSVAPNRERFRAVIGAVDPRVVARGVQSFSNLEGLEDVRPAIKRGIRVLNVQWQVLDGISADGLLILPEGDPVARIVALPDADWTPEMLAGVTEGIDPQSQIARRLAENGCEVLIPTLISRDDEFSGSPFVCYTNQPHREFIYRMAFEMGRHVIGYEVQKVLAAVDVFEQRNALQNKDLPIGVAGIGEGGLLAFYSAAVDSRIGAAMICGYFQQREGVWQEPIYRNVWSLLAEFGDAEIASLIAPRPLVIEACAVPEIAGPPKPRKGRRTGAAPGKIAICPLDSVRAEFSRAKDHYSKLDVPKAVTLAVSGQGDGLAGTDAALSAFLNGLGSKRPLKPIGQVPIVVGTLVDSSLRQQRQVAEMVEFTQKLQRLSAKVRDKLWSKVDRSSVEAWEKSAEFYRDLVYEEMIGKLPPPSMPLNPRSRQVLDDPAYRGYEVVLDVYPDVIAAGILLLPKNLKPDEKRPVVVCQHGLEGVPLDTILSEGRAHRAYKSFSAELAKRGFIVYAPQNPYRGDDEFRSIQRKSNPMKRSLFSYIIPQHERTLQWLSTLPNVDPARIGFYGLSYGGKTAVRVPPMVKQYALSICSGDFNEWVKKNVSSEDRYSYVFTGEYEIFEWNMGHVANYAELSTLMTPRPFMVERGHRDGVAPDEWVAWEYAKVRRHYDELGLGDRTEIEFFNGPHAINGQGTYRFLHRHLNWPEQ